MYPYGTSFYNNITDVPVGQIISGASNIKAGANTAFTAANFTAFYPQFIDLQEGAAKIGYTLKLVIPDAAFTIFLAEANGRVQENRWHSQWLGGMCNYIAHKATLYLAATTVRDVQGLIASSMPRAVMTSKSVDGVSVSYDTESIARDLDGYGDFKSTTYGQQFASTAKLLGKGGMMIW